MVSIPFCVAFSAINFPTAVATSVFDPSALTPLSLEALGLKKIGQSVEHADTPNILGMVKKVKHLVSVEETK